MWGVISESKGGLIEGQLEDPVAPLHSLVKISSASEPGLVLIS
jgi:hypothetical protein